MLRMFRRQRNLLPGGRKLLGRGFPPIDRSRSIAIEEKRAEHKTNAGHDAHRSRPGGAGRGRGEGVTRSTLVEVAVVDAQERRGVLERRRTERETRSSVGRSRALRRWFPRRR